MDATRIDWKAVPAEEVLPGIFRQTVTGGESTLVRYTYQPGCVFPVHTHPEEQITVVHSGKIVFEIDGTALPMGAGQVAVIPGNTPHGARVTADTPVVTDNYLPAANRAPISYQPEP